MSRVKSCFILIFLLTFICSLALAQDVQKSTIDDQKQVEVTVYNSNLGLIKDIRRIKLNKGEGELRFMDVAAYIMPETVHVKSLSLAGQFRVLEQNYEYDLISYAKLLDKFVGKKIKILKENYYTDTTKTVEATLLSNNNGQPVYNIDGEIYLGYNGLSILPQIPENLIAKPTLTWQYESQSSADTDVEVSYLTQNISWKADYVLVLDKEDKLGDLSGWVTIDNKSGAAYEDAVLKLVAGEVNQVTPQSLRKDAYMGDALMAREMVSAPMFTEQGFFEYHIYDLQRPTTIKDNQTKQISLLEAAGVKIEKEFVVYGEKTWFTYQYQENQPKQPVNVNVKFKNEKENKLGMPLPKGIVRLYKQDSAGKLQFAGEDNIDHTPKDEEVSLKVGEAFDIVVERKQTDFRQITTRLHESEWEITLKNHKEEAVVVGLVEPLYGSWQIINSTHPHTKVDAFTLRFDVPVEKDEEVKVKYRIQVGLK